MNIEEQQFDIEEQQFDIEEQQFDIEEQQFDIEEQQFYIEEQQFDIEEQQSNRKFRVFEVTLSDRIQILTTVKVVFLDFIPQKKEFLILETSYLTLIQNTAHLL